jgi:D-amino-acid oxidase
MARDFPGPFETIDSETQINYTSPWGGAHNRWVLPTNAHEERDHVMARRTFTHMESIAVTDPAAGITFMKGIEYLESPPPEYRALNNDTASALGLTDFRLLNPKELPEKVTWGCEYKTWCVNPMVYCSFLLRKFVHRGGKIVKRDLGDLLEAFALKVNNGACATAVINCSGVGFNDPDVYIIRG